jgi:hypothetical protein
LPWYKPGWYKRLNSSGLRVRHFHWLALHCPHQPPWWKGFFQKDCHVISDLRDNFWSPHPLPIELEFWVHDLHCGHNVDTGNYGLHMSACCTSNSVTFCEPKCLARTHNSCEHWVGLVFLSWQGLHIPATMVTASSGGVSSVAFLHSS